MVNLFKVDRGCYKRRKIQLGAYVHLIYHHFYLFSICIPNFFLDQIKDIFLHVFVRCLNSS